MQFNLLFMLYALPVAIITKEVYDLHQLKKRGIATNERVKEFNSRIDREKDQVK